MGSQRWSAAFVVALFLMFTAGAQAQWVLAAHAAKNQINRMTQHSASGGYDVATVVLDANPSNVYDKTLERLKTHTDLTITKQDKEMGTIEIKKGKQVLGFQIYALGPKETQMIVASGSGKSKGSDATPLVVDSIMRVCKEFNVQCTAASNSMTVSTP
jgi:hypothetical protein